MNNLRDFAGSSASTATVQEGGYSKEGLSKDGKGIVRQEAPIQKNITQRWGVWADYTGYYGSGRNVNSGSLGIDYRIREHWIIGTYANMYYTNHSIFTGGVYTAFYARDFWLVAGGELGANVYDLYASTGYDFHYKNLIFGPVVSVQYDHANKDIGFGTGTLFQERVGGRLALNMGRFRPEVQVMWQGQNGDVYHGRDSAIWASIGASYSISDHWTAYAATGFEGNGRYQQLETNVGLRFGF